MIEDNRILWRWIIQSSFVGNSTVILGDFYYLMLGFFGTTDLVIDPFSSASSAIAKITTHLFFYVAERQPEAFCKINMS